jgi:flagellar basal-body rod modification protein FlgD
MAIDATAATGTSSSPLGNLGIQDFLKILTSQLNNQDPLKPIDNQDFIAQIAQFTTLEQSQQLNQKIDQLLTQQSANQSVGMLGKTVEVTSNGSTVTGTVAAVSLSSGTPHLTITTSGGSTVSDISLSQVNTIR